MMSASSMYSVALRVTDPRVELAHLRTGLEARARAGTLAEFTLAGDYARLALPADDRDGAVRAAVALCAALGVERISVLGAIRCQGPGHHPAPDAAA